MTRACDRCGARVVDTVGSRQASLFDLDSADPRATDGARAELRAGRILCPACQRTPELFEGTAASLPRSELRRRCVEALEGPDPAALVAAGAGSVKVEMRGGLAGLRLEAAGENGEEIVGVLMPMQVQGEVGIRVRVGPAVGDEPAPPTEEQLEVAGDAP